MPITRRHADLPHFVAIGATMHPLELKTVLSSGLLSFPITDFDAQGDFRKNTYIERLEWLAPYGASALFAAGGTGEFFSLTHEEYPEIIKTAVDTCRGKVPILAGVGGPTRAAIKFAQAAEAQGASGLLLLPHYLSEASQDGLVRHVEEVCRSVKIGRLPRRGAPGHPGWLRSGSAAAAAGRWRLAPRRLGRT